MDKYTMGDIHKALSLLEGEDPVVIEREELEELRRELSRLSALASTPDNRGRARRRALLDARGRHEAVHRWFFSNSSVDA